MGKIVEILLAYKFIVLIVIILIVLVIIGYFVDKYINKKENSNSKIKISNAEPLVKMSTYNGNLDNDGVLYQNVTSENINNIIEEKKTTSSKKMEEQIKDSVYRIVSDADKNLDDLNGIISDKNIVEELKSKFDDMEMKIDPIKDPKIKKSVDVNIKLPDIDLSVYDEIIWK